jgi:hypothetical protein
MLRDFGIRSDFPVDVDSTTAQFFPGSLASVAYVPPGDGEIERMILFSNLPIRRDILAFEIGHLKLTCMLLPHFEKTEPLAPPLMFFGVFHDEFYDRLLLSRDLPAASSSLMQLEAENLPDDSQMYLDLSAAAIPQTPRNVRMLQRMTQWTLDKIVCSRSPALHRYLPDFDRVLEPCRNSTFNDFMLFIEAQLSSMPALPNATSRFGQSEQSAVLEAVAPVHRYVFGRLIPLRRVRYSISCA